MYKLCKWSLSIPANHRLTFVVQN